VTILNFTIYGTPAKDRPLSLFVRIGGTAVPSLHYFITQNGLTLNLDTLSTSFNLTLPSNQTQVEFEVNSIPVNLVAGAKTVVFTLEAIGDSRVIPNFTTSGNLPIVDPASLLPPPDVLGTINNEAITTNSGNQILII
jgi:hypothetical protein